MRPVKLAIALAVALSLSACGGEKTLKIGVAGPLTGKDAVFGAQLKNGVDQAVQDINAAGGLNGQKLELVFGDDAADPKQGRSVANTFVGEGVSFVVGHFNSGVTEPASDIYAEHGILMITPGSTNPKITDRGLSNVFRTCGRDDQQGKIAGEYIAQHFKDKKVAIAHDKTTYGKGLADETKKTMNGLGVQEVLYEGINAGERDFSALVSKIKASGAQAVFTGNWGNDLTLLVRALREVGSTARLYTFYGNALGAPAAIGEAGVGAVLAVAEWQPNVPGAPSADFRAEFKRRFPDPKDDYLHARMQVLVEMLAAAIERAGATEAAAVARALEGAAYDGRTLGGVHKAVMRADDHQLQQPLVVSVMDRAGAPGVPHDVEGSGFGFRVLRRFDSAAAPHACRMLRPD